MPTITRELLLRNQDLDQVLSWLGEPDHHVRLLRGAFDAVNVLDHGTFELSLDASGLCRRLGYEIRRGEPVPGEIGVDVTGKCLEGRLVYRTTPAKSTTDVLVTLRLEYTTIGLLAAAIDALAYRGRLETALTKVLSNLRKEISI